MEERAAVVIGLSQPVERIVGVVDDRRRLNRGDGRRSRCGGRCRGRGRGRRRRRRRAAGAGRRGGGPVAVELPGRGLALEGHGEGVGVAARFEGRRLPAILRRGLEAVQRADGNLGRLRVLVDVAEVADPAAVQRFDTSHGRQERFALDGLDDGLDLADQRVGRRLADAVAAVALDDPQELLKLLGGPRLETQLQEAFGQAQAALEPDGGHPLDLARVDQLI